MLSGLAELTPKNLGCVPMSLRQAPGKERQSVRNTFGQLPIANCQPPSSRYLVFAPELLLYALHLVFEL